MIKIKCCDRNKSKSSSKRIKMIKKAIIVDLAAGVIKEIDKMINMSFDMRLKAGVWGRNVKRSKCSNINMS